MFAKPAHFNPKQARSTFETAYTNGSNFMNDEKENMDKNIPLALIFKEDGLEKLLSSEYTSPKLSGMDSRTDRISTNLIDSLEKSHKNFLSTCYPQNRGNEKNIINRY